MPAHHHDPADIHPRRDDLTRAHPRRDVLELLDDRSRRVLAVIADRWRGLCTQSQSRVRERDH